MYDNDKIEAFYTPKILLSLARQSRLNSSFGEKYREMCDFENDKEKFRQKSLALVAGIKEIIEDENKENSQKEIIDEILYFFDIGLCDLETVRENISIEYIQDKFINDEISTEEILELYQKGIIDDEVVSEYFSDEELIELYENGKINIDCLKCIRNTDYIIDSFYSKKISFKDLVNLYLKFNELSIEDLICSIELAKANSDDIFKFIDKDTSFEKIKELFKNMLIDYSSILLLREQGIISDEQFEKIKESISTKDFFEELNSGKKFKVMTLRESSSSQKKKSSNKSSIIDKSQNDFSDEIDLISKILNNDIQEELDNGNVSYIESYNLDDKPTSLNNYRVFCNEDLDGIVILQKSKKGNAVFVMNVLQLMYFLKGKENANGEIEIQDRMKDKAYLKNIEGVEVVEHSKNFGRNLVEASARVSPKIYERLKISDKKYIEDVEEMVNFMRELYLEKSKSISIDDN